MDTLSGEVTLSKLFLPPSWKEVYSKRKEFAPLGSTFFPFRVDHFSEGAYEQKSKQEVTKIVSLVQKGVGGKGDANLPSVPSPLKITNKNTTHYFDIFFNLNLDNYHICQKYIYTLASYNTYLKP